MFEISIILQIHDNLNGHIECAVTDSLPSCVITVFPKFGFDADGLAVNFFE